MLLSGDSSASIYLSLVSKANDCVDKWTRHPDPVALANLTRFIRNQQTKHSYLFGSIATVVLKLIESTSQCLF